MSTLEHNKENITHLARSVVYGMTREELETQAVEQLIREYQDEVLFRDALRQPISQRGIHALRSDIQELLDSYGGDK